MSFLYPRAATALCALRSCFPGADKPALEGEARNVPEHTAPAAGRCSGSPGPTASPKEWEEEEEQKYERSLPELADVSPQQPEPHLSEGLGETEQTPRPLKLILVGKSGSGKSATGNSIVGRKVFESKLSARPVTETFQRERFTRDGKELEVIDTPDVLSPAVPLEVAARAFREGTGFSAPGPHVVLLVMQLGRFTEEDLEVVSRLQGICGEGVLASTVLVFTRKEDLDGGSLQEYLRDTDNQDLGVLDVVCERRHCGFNNRAEGDEQEAQLKELMHEVGVILWEAEGGCDSSTARRPPGETFCSDQSRAGGHRRADAPGSCPAQGPGRRGSKDPEDIRGGSQTPPERTPAGLEPGTALPREPPAAPVLGSQATAGPLCPMGH